MRERLAAMCISRESRNGVKAETNKRKPAGKRRLGPLSTDRHRLYEYSVQSPSFNIEFFDRVYKRAWGRPARSLKEDFCGTALLATEWVRTRPGNVAVAVDTDAKTLAWARANNLVSLSPTERSRIKLVRADVREIRSPKVEIVAAFNFSYFEFKTRRELLGYFLNARRSLKPGGLLILDMFGGWEAQMEVTDKTRNPGFTYVWEQTKFDPISHSAGFHIHFDFHGGGGIRKAFKYDWRMWTIPEVRELLAEAGFSSIDVYWEGIDAETGEGNGVFKRVTKAENCPGWIAMLVATRGLPARRLRRPR